MVVQLNWSQIELSNCLVVVTVVLVVFVNIVVVVVVVWLAGFACGLW